jgi:hypothetical protein
MFLVIMFIIYFDYMVSIVRIIIVFIHMFAKALTLVHVGVTGQHCVSVVLICCLPTDTPYVLGRVVDRECDTFVESFVVHSLNVGQVGPGCERSQALFFIFFSNLPYGRS